MTDKEKLEKVKAEIERRIDLYSGLSEETVNPNRIDEDRQILSFIDSLQAAPVSEEWVEELRIRFDSISKEDFKKVFDKYAIDFNKEPVSEGLEKELSRLLKDCEIDSEYIHQDFLHIVANHFADWQKERIEANSTNATIGLPYENKYGGYTHLIDISRPLPVGNNIIAIIFKED